VIDKLLGDEVMAFFVKGISGPQYRRQAVLVGVDLLRAVGLHEIVTRSGALADVLARRARLVS
jgi:hypothetical protein